MVFLPEWFRFLLALQAASFLGGVLISFSKPGRQIVKGNAPDNGVSWFYRDRLLADMSL
jgi:hypothetical protein